jgi:uncharacterized protein
MTTSAQSNRVSIGDKVAFLCSPESYPKRPLRVEVIETHMSWVFLTHHRVYKLKKPVRYDVLDFSTLAARRRNCEREVDLNRRLAPAVYRGIVPLTLTRDRRLHIEGTGHVVDWLVVMRPLPNERMLDYAIAANSVTAGNTQRLAHLLADFYRRAKPLPATTTRYRKHFAAQIDANRAELMKPDYALPVRLIAQVTQAQREFLQAQSAELTARACHVVDAHGDLRPEHVCLTPRPVVIDCLEFKRAFRLLDPADELAYFAMECARLGSADIGDQVMHQVLKTLHDAPGDNLIRFYKAFRATMRAKIAIWHLADRHINHAAHWRRRARAYLAMALRYAPHDATTIRTAA